MLYTICLFCFVTGSFEQSPNLVEVYGSWPGNAGQVPTRSGEVPEDRLRESIADAMIEAGPTHKDGGPLSGHGKLINEKKTLKIH